MPANLRKIWNVSFWNCQHYREWGPSDRAMPANLRKIRSVSFWICQPYRRSGASDRTMPANLRRIGIAHQNCDASGVSGAGRVPFPSCPGDFCCRGNVSATFRRAVPIIRGDCRKFNIYILVLIISLAVSNGRKYHDARWVFARPLVPFGFFPPEKPTLSRI